MQYISHLRPYHTSFTTSHIQSICAYHHQQCSKREEVLVHEACGVRQPRLVSGSMLSTAPPLLNPFNPLPRPARPEVSSVKGDRASGVPEVGVLILHSEVSAQYPHKLVLQESCQSEHVLRHRIVRFSRTGFRCLERMPHMDQGAQQCGEIYGTPERGRICGALAPLLDLVDVL